MMVENDPTKRFQESPEESLSNQYDIHRLIAGIQRHSLLIFLLTLLGLILGGLIAYHRITSYEADAIILFQEDKDFQLPGGSTLPTMTLPTALDLIESPGNFNAVTKILGIEKSRPSVKSMVDVPKPRHNSNFIHIFAYGDDPLLAVQVANTMAKTAVKASQDFTQRQLLIALESYKAQLASVVKRLNSQSKEVEDFKSQNKLLEMTSDFIQFTTLLNSVRSRVEDASLLYNSQFVEFENLNAAVAQLPETLPFNAEKREGAFTPLQQRILSLQDAISRAKLKYAKENPRLKILEAELLELTGQWELQGAKETGKEKLSTGNPLKERLQLELLKLEGRVKASKQNKEDLELYYAELVKEQEHLPSKQVAFDKLLQSKQLTENEVKTLTDAVGITQLMINWPRGSLELYELAEKATPRGTWVLGMLLPLLGATLGILLGTFISFILELRDTKLHTARQVEIKYRIPCLTVIPDIKYLNAKNIEVKMLFFSRGLAERLENVLLKRAKPGNHFRALFGSSRTNSLSRKWPDAVVRDEAIVAAIAEERNTADGHLQASESVREDPNKAHFSIGMTSSVEGEGKNLLSTSLAHYYCRLGKSVLLLTTNPVPIFNNPYNTKKTLADFLRDPNDVKNLIIEGPFDQIKLAEEGDLELKELLKSEEMSSLWNKLRQTYERVIINIPGVIDYVYATNLLIFTDLRLFVINSSETPQQFIDESLNHLDQHHISVDGIILNRVLPIFINDQRTLNEINRSKGYFWHQWFPSKQRPGQMNKTDRMVTKRRSQDASNESVTKEDIIDGIDNPKANEIGLTKKQPTSRRNE